MTGSERRVLVVGGGIIGIACAHYLNRDGFRVTVIDQGRISGECSHGNCGLICPSHVLPLAEPGALGAAAAAMLQSNSPLRIRPRWDARFWQWMYRFAARCNRDDMVASGRAIQPLLQSSMQQYQELIQDPTMECEWQRRGLLFVYQSQAAFAGYSATNDLMTDEFDEPAVRLDAAELRTFEPSLRDDLAGGWYFEHDAHLRPDKLIASWVAALRGRGVVFQEHCQLESLDTTRGDVQIATTSAGRLAADAFVIATGARTPKLRTSLQRRIPIEPGKGYSITLPVRDPMPTHPMIFPEHRVAVTPMDTGLRIGSMMEFVGYDDRIPPERLRLLTTAASTYLRGEPFDEQWPERWFGWRPMTVDSLPFIGVCPGFANVYVAAGHNMLGLSMAPGTGLLISDLISGRTPHIPIAPYAADRF